MKIELCTENPTRHDGYVLKHEGFYGLEEAVHTEEY